MKINDAASIVLIDQHGDGPRILMGRRSRKHQFMPNVFVFPGGRVDYADRFAPFAHDYNDETLDLLLQQMKGRPTALRARMLGLAAIRETYEEVGLMLGCPQRSQRSYKNPAWNAFAAEGVLPDLSALTFIARAITPPGRNRRFDTRFFLVTADDYLKNQTIRSSDELEDVQWVSFDEAFNLPTHFITQQILKAAQSSLSHREQKTNISKVPFYRAKKGGDSFAKHLTYLKPYQAPDDGGEVIVEKT